MGLATGGCSPMRWGREGALESLWLRLLLVAIEIAAGAGRSGWPVSWSLVCNIRRRAKRHCRALTLTRSDRDGKVDGL